jgi:hypothetical protein
MIWQWRPETRGKQEDRLPPSPAQPGEGPPMRWRAGADWCAGASLEPRCSSPWSSG